MSDANKGETVIGSEALAAMRPDSAALPAVRSLRDWVAVDVRTLDARERAVAAVIAACGVALAALAAYTIYHRFGAPANQYDLRIYYHALASWRSGASLYGYWQWDPVNGILGFTYPPAAALLLSPMTMLPLGLVVVLFGAAIFASTAALVLIVVRQRVRLRRPQLLVLTALATAAAFCLQPISQTAAYGQVNVFLALLVAFDVFVLARGGSRWAGVGIGLATAIKLTPAVFLLYLALSGQWRMLRVAVTTAAGVTVAAALCAPAATGAYFTSLLWDSSRVGVLDNTANQSLNGLLARLSAPLPPDRLAWLAAALMVSVFGALRIRRAVAAGNPLAAVTITGLLGVLVSPVSWLHHAVWILPAMVVLGARLIASFPLQPVRLLLGGRSRVAALPPAYRRQLGRWAGIAVLTVSGLLIFVVNTRNLFGLPDTHYAGRGMFAVLAGSAQTLWMVAAVALLPVVGAIPTITDISGPAASSRTASGTAASGTAASGIAGSRATAPLSGAAASGNAESPATAPLSGAVTTTAAERRAARNG